MLILTDEDRAKYREFSAKTKEELGLSHLSPSSLSSYRDCSEKLTHRANFNSFSLKMTAGSGLHNVCESVAVKVKNMLLADEQITFEEAKKSAFENINLMETYVAACLAETVDKPDESGSTRMRLVDPKDKEIFEDKVALRAVYATIGRDLTSELISGVLDFPTVYTEVDVFIVVDDAVIFGRIDEISYDPKGDIWYIDDIKTSWSAKSKPAESLSTKFQLWFYKKAFEESFPGVKVETRIKWIKGIWPADDKPEPKVESEEETPGKKKKVLKAKKPYVKPPRFTLEIIPLKMTQSDDIMHMANLRSSIRMIKSDCTNIGNAQYGCKYCDYNGVCSYSDYRP